MNLVPIYVYVIRSVVNGRCYVGITKDLEGRLDAHRKRRSKGGQQLREFELVLVEEYPDYATARLREKYLKSGQGREWLKAYLQRGD